MSGVLIIAIVVMVIALLAGTPAGFAFFGAALIIALAGGYDISELASYGYLEMSVMALLSVPLILFMGIIMRRCGVSEDKLKLFIPSGLAMILYAFAGGQSIAACLLASVVPVIVLVLLHMLVSKLLAARAAKLQEKAELAEDEVVSVNADDEDKASVAEKIAETEMTDVSGAADSNDEEDDENDEQQSLVPAFIAPVLIFIGACSGIMTVAEAAAVAAIYILIVGWHFYRELDGDDLKETLVETGTKAGSILLTVFSAMILARLFMMENVPYSMLEGLTSISDNRSVSVLLVILLLVIAGVLTDKISAVLLTTPIIVQVVIFMGINPVQFAVIAVLSIGIGCRLISRPVKENLMYLGLAWLPTLLLTTYIPRFSLILPLLLGYI